MNPFAYKTTGLAIKTLSAFLKARVDLHHGENIPKGANIFVINHFTRVETLLLPYHISRLTQMPVWSLADYTLFKGALGTFLDNVGVVSTRNPDRDLLIVRSLLTGEAHWIIFPEGRMVKSKKIVERGRFMISYAGGKHPPHTGAATLALRTEFYRRRIGVLLEKNPEEARRILDLFGIESPEPILNTTTHIVPVNITFYPIRAKENLASNLAANLLENLPKRAQEEIMTEGTLLFSHTDVDIRFGSPIYINEYMKQRAVVRNLSTDRRFSFDDPIPAKGTLRKMALTIMQRYMDAIYTMTTVNHDHLFASVLRLSPFRKMGVYDLRRRVFLATTRRLSRMGIHLHSSLKADQVPLLTDDRHGRFREFLALAEEKGIISQRGEVLIKDMSRFSSPLDFHTVRIDNPISVIANEVEPLGVLQKALRRLTWTPRFLLRKRIADYLIRRTEEQYREDYEAFFLQEESRDFEAGRPFLLRGKSRRLGVLLLHGYMAGPMEVTPLAESLHRRGYWVYAPRLRGHGTCPEDLATRTHRDWRASVDEGYAIIRNSCRRVAVGGFSTGAALALDLAARIDDIEGVFAVCPPRRLQDLSDRFGPAPDFWARLKEMVRLGPSRKEFIENTPENPDISYRRNPVSGIREVELLMDDLLPRLSAVRPPALVIHSHRDPVADASGSKQIFEGLGSTDKRHVLFDFDRHCIILGDGAPRVHRVIWEFIRSLEGEHIS